MGEPNTSTFIVEIEFDRPVSNRSQARYIRASLEEGIALCWHDYMANAESAPQIPKQIRARQKRAALAKE